MEKRGYKKVGSRRTHTHHQKHTYLLTELLVCKHCGGKFSGTTKTTQESYYRCRTKNNKFRRDKSPDYAGCTSNRYSVKPTDELVWNAVVGENSHVFKERIKRENSVTFHRSTSEMKTWKKIKKGGRWNRKTGDSIVNLKTELLVGNVDDQDLDKIVTKLEERRTELQKQKDILVTQLDTEQSNRVWVDWLKEFGKRIEQLRNPEMTVAERKRFLQGVVDTVEVRSLDKRGHTLDIKFLFPFVDDALSKNAKGQFAPVDGKHTLRTRGFLSKKTNA